MSKINLQIDKSAPKNYENKQEQNKANFVTHPK